MPNIKGIEPVSGVTVSTLSKIVSEQGAAALWRGNNALVYGQLTAIIMRVTIFDRMKNYYMPLDSSRYTGLSYYGRIFMASSATVSITSAMTYPYDLIYSRLGGDMTKKGSLRHYRTVFDCFNRTNIDEGLRTGLYKGIEIAMVAQVLRALLMFPVYDIMRSSKHLQPEQSGQSNYIINNFKEKLGVSFVSAMLIAAIVYPLDTVKRNVQVNGGRGYFKTYQNSFHCFRELVIT